ncbi:MAG TPA: cyclic nucleotide-binding domain-containing protein, partial [Geminicoccaceae bacterium]|nr:cyclic nucleotide-binding domain-containing protein [Geminicoccaceae bacterium]
RAEVVESAVRCLGRIGSRRAREALAGFLRPRYARAERCLGLLRRLPPGRDRAAWAAFEIAVHDRSLRVLDAVTDVLAALGEDRLVASLRRAALAATDRWTRASALEALTCLPHRRLVLPILPLLEAMLVAREPAGERRTADHAPAPAADGAALLDDAAADEDPWIRLGAARTARALGGTVGGRATPAPRDVAAGRPARTEGTAVTPTESDMERVLLLKRVPLFRYLPLDTLLAVGRVLERRAYVAGETVFEAGSRSDHFCIVESGAVEVFGDGRAAPSPERLVAPAWFGELVLVDEVPRSPRVVAAEDCALLRLHRIVFHDLSRDHPEVLLELCRLLARRLRQVQGGGAAILAR